MAWKLPLDRPQFFLELKKIRSFLLKSASQPYSSEDGWNNILSYCLLEYFYLMKKSAKVLVNPFGRQKTVLKTKKIWFPIF
jgi:hypothetical protein